MDSDSQADKADVVVYQPANSNTRRRIWKQSHMRKKMMMGSLAIKENIIRVTQLDEADEVVHRQTGATLQIEPGASMF